MVVQGVSSPAVAYDVAMRRLDEQMRQIDAVDNKIGVLLVAASTVIAVFAGFAAVAVDTGERPSLVVGTVFVALAGACYVVAMSLSILAFRFTQWDQRPNWDALLKYSRQYDDDAMRFWVAEGCILSLGENTQRLHVKLVRAGWATVFLGLEVAVAAAGLLSIIIANGVTS